MKENDQGRKRNKRASKDERGTKETIKDEKKNERNDQG
jgi:hypothetical protein